MNDRQKRLNEVYDYLRRFYGIHTKKDFALALRYGRTSLSAAMNGGDSYLTDNLFKNICSSFPGVFNLDYLLTGEGTLLANETQPATPERVATPTTYDVSILIEKAVEKATAYSDKCIAILEKQVEDLRRGIETRDRVINTLQQKINAMQLDDTLDKYPFTVGIAEPSIPDPEQKHV